MNESINKGLIDVEMDSEDVIQKKLQGLNISSGTVTRNMIKKMNKNE